MFTLGRTEPHEDEVLVYVVASIHHKEGFAKVRLCEYGDMDAMLPFTHLSRKRSIRSVKKYVSVGKRDVGRVLMLEKGHDETCHPTLSRTGIEDKERTEVLEACGHRSRLVKWCVHVAHQIQHSIQHQTKDQPLHQELYDAYMLPLMSIGQPWNVLRDVSVDTLVGEGQPWHKKQHKKQHFDVPLDVLQRANRKFFPKPPVKVTVNFEARGTSVDALQAFGAHLETTRPDLRFAVVTPPRYMVTKDNVDQGDASALIEAIHRLLSTPFDGVTVTLNKT